MSNAQPPTPPPSAICGIGISQWQNMSACSARVANANPVCAQPSTECKALLQGECSKYDSGKFTVSNFVDWNVCVNEAQCKPGDAQCMAKATANCCNKIMS
jgi:hypothetical protein